MGDLQLAKWRKPTVAELQRIFGKATIFLPCRRKVCHRKGWPQTTILDVDEELIRKVDIAPQTSVLCGWNSDGLVCIDLDEAGALDRLAAGFFSQGLKTTRIGGRPGRAKYFFRVPKGDAGKKHKLTANGVPVGDFIANGGQAIVAGLHHETGMPYRLDDDSTPMRVAVPQLYEWLSKAGIDGGQRGRKSQPDCDAGCSDAEHRKNNTRSIYVISEKQSDAIDEIARRVACLKQVEARLAKEPQNIQRLYTDHIAQRWKPVAGERNKFVVECVPVLLRRVAPTLITKLVTAFFDLHAELFHDSREAHVREAEAQLRSCLKTYRDSLDRREAQIYDNLSDRAQALFRICRDLARSKELESPTFYLSAQQAALRMEEREMTMWRELAKMEECGLLAKVKLGTRRELNVRGEATIWRWNMSLEPRFNTMSEE